MGNGRRPFDRSMALCRICTVDVLMIFYTDKFIPEGAVGCARGPVIFIRPQYKDDRGLLEHEKVHRRQSWRGLLIIHALRYTFSKKYRLACEVKAYSEQAKHYEDDRLPKFACYIATKYGLKITEEDALKLLREAE